MIAMRESKTLLSNKLSQLWYQGCVAFERWELLSWYGKDRITAVVWRDIEENWMAFFPNGDAPPLGVIKCDDSTTPQKYFVLNTSAVFPLETLTKN